MEKKISKKEMKWKEYLDLDKNITNEHNLKIDDLKSYLNKRNKNS